jgi:hypothetical protein
VFTHPAYVTAGIAVLALATWAGFALMGGGEVTRPGDEGQVVDMPEGGAQPAEVGPTVVRLAPPLPDLPPAVPDAGQELGEIRLGIRLVRGFSGVVPEDVQTIDPLAAGGADPLADVRSEVTSLPFEQYGLVGRWEGDLSSSSLVEVDLSGNHILTFATAEHALSGGYVELTDVRLVGETDILVASTLRLEPGRLYLLGVVAPREDAPSIILAIQADVASGDQNGNSSTH